MVNAIMCGGYAQTVNLKKPDCSPSPSTASSPSPCGVTTDTVSISDEAKSAESSDPFPSLREGGRTVYLEDIEEALSRETAAVEKKLQSLYAQLGISSSAQMKISVGGDGSILVKGESPEAEALAEAINEDAELANTIRGMSAKASLLAAAEEAEEFAAAYDEDPVAAVKRYGYLFNDDRQHNVSFMVQNGQINTKVTTSV